MIGKSGVWAHFGSWNFKKAFAWIEGKDISLEQAIKYTKDI